MTLLVQVMRALRQQPLLVLLSARAGELPDNPAVLGLLRGLRHDRQLEELAHHAAMDGEDRLAAEGCIHAGRRCLRLLAGTEAALLALRARRHAERLKEPERTRLLIDSLRVHLLAQPPAEPETMIREIEALAERAVDFGLVEHARRGFRMLRACPRSLRGVSSACDRAPARSRAPPDAGASGKLGDNAGADRQSTRRVTLAAAPASSLDDRRCSSIDGHPTPRICSLPSS